MESKRLLRFIGLLIKDSLARLGKLSGIEPPGPSELTHHLPGGSLRNQHSNEPLPMEGILLTLATPDSTLT